jgi:CRP/FNR family transcriptional regulator, dissimilatory nitrate respiration regulator
MDMYDDRSSIIHALQQCQLFAGTGENTLRWLLDQQGCGVRHFHKEAIIAFRGDRYERLMLVLTGSMTAEFQDFRGKVLKVESIREGETAAAAVLFAADNLLPVTLTAEKECYLFEVPKKTVFQAMQRSIVLLENILTDMGDRVTLLADKMYSLQFSTIKQKISAYILDLANKQGTESPELRVTKEVLSEIFGVTRPALSRCFSSMVKEGYFTQEGKIIHINTISDLEDAVEEE